MTALGATVVVVLVTVMGVAVVVGMTAACEQNCMSKMAARMHARGARVLPFFIEY